MKKLLFLLVAASLSGCASDILENKEKEVFVDSKTTKVEPTDERVKSLEEARDLALRLSAAYYAAANESQNTQDAINIVTNLVGASVIAGAVKGTSDAALANRGIAAVGLQRIGAKGFSKTTIEALYDGSLSLDCVAGVISVHIAGGKLKDITAAKILTLHAIREIRISVRKGLTRDVDTYSSILESFSSAVPKDVDIGFRVEQEGDKTQRLNAYLKILNGCVTKKGVTGAANG